VHWPDVKFGYTNVATFDSALRASRRSSRCYHHIIQWIDSLLQESDAASAPILQKWRNGDVDVAGKWPVDDISTAHIVEGDGIEFKI